MSPKYFLIALPLLCLMLSAPTHAQQKTGTQKKLYCWDQQGQRICSDTLPPEAVNAARDEFSTRSSLRKEAIGRTLTADEKAEQSLLQAQQQAAAAADQTRRRTEQAMLSSFSTEDELRRVFDERITLSENNVQTARYNATNLHQGLASLLTQAGERELQGNKIPEANMQTIVQRKRDLNNQLRLLSIFEQQHRDLDAEINQTLIRYRELKAAEKHTASR